MLKLLLCLTLIALGLVIPAKLMRHADPNDPPAGCTTTLGCGGLYVLLLIGFVSSLFYGGPRLHIVNDTNSKTIVVQVGKQQQEVPRGGHAELALETQGFWRQSVWRLEAKTKNGAPVETVTLNSSGGDWIYNVKGRSRLVLVDYAGIYTVNKTTVKGVIPISSKDSGRRPTYKLQKTLNGKLFECGDGWHTWETPLPDSIDSDSSYLRVEHIPFGENSDTAIRNRLYQDTGVNAVNESLTGRRGQP